MFSSRLTHSFEPNRLASALAAHALKGVRLLDLTISNPTQAGLNYPREEIIAALADTRALTYEPHPQGLLAARENIAALYGSPMSASRIVLTASTSEAYSYLFKLLCDPEDEILVPRPSYPLFEFLADLECVRIRQYALFYDDGWHIDISSVRDLITSRTRAIVLVNPNNPTGSFLKQREHMELADICARGGMAVISDEVFADFAFEEDEQRVQTLAARSNVLTFVLNGLSKSAGLPQMKLGWIAITGPDSAVREALQRLELVADTFLSVNTAVQWAAGRLLESGEAVHRQIRDRTKANLRQLRDMMRGTVYGVLAVEAGWYAVVQAPRTKPEEQWVLGLLEESDVLVQPGYFYDFASEPFLILSLLTPEDVFIEGVRRMLQFAGN